MGREGRECIDKRGICDKIRKNASHGTGMILIEEPIPKSGERSFLEKEIDRLVGFGKGYAIKEHSLDLFRIKDKLLKGITAIDGAVFCNFDFTMQSDWCNR